MKMSDFRSIVVDDVRIVGMIRRIVLMVGLGRIKSLQRNYLSHDWTREHTRFIELRDISVRNPFLIVVAVENNRPILRA